MVSFGAFFTLVYESIIQNDSILPVLQVSSLHENQHTKFEFDRDYVTDEWSDELLLNPFLLLLSPSSSSLLLLLLLFFVVVAVYEAQ